MARISRGDNPYHLDDVYFTLYDDSARVSVIATLSQTFPGEFISISPLVTTFQGANNITSSERTTRNDSNFYIISGSEVKIIPAGSQGVRLAVPGGFQQFTGENDARLERA